MGRLISRWHRARRYECAHDCPREATLLSPGCVTFPYAHNCCGRHVKPVAECDCDCPVGHWASCALWNKG